MEHKNARSMAKTRNGRPFPRRPPRHVFIRLEIQEIKWSSMR
ncbi:hypothetical protein C7S15_5619 [Burkholderia cepacia]|nr:hypothetical protein [Burkholderia cepacia]